MSDWEPFLDEIRTAYRLGQGDPEVSHAAWESAAMILARMVLDGDPATRKAARLTSFTRDRVAGRWWYA